MATGAYDGVSASGDATLRLIAKGDVAPVNFDLIPNYADVFDGLKNQSYNNVDGVGYGVPHGRGANLMVWNTNDLPKTNTSWAPIWPGTDYKGKLSIYDNQIFIADAAIYLKATQPDLNITNPYELDDDQFNAAVDLLKQQRPNIGEYWDGSTYAKQVTSFKSGESAVGTTWQYMRASGTSGDSASRGSSSPASGSRSCSIRARSWSSTGSYDIARSSSG